ncbi:hypothetical protein [Spirillospora sp. NPDC029432]|uniref:hypothetical protein n=1 Tax=Spirillospora sp. NPDC029432 TaxID=3154599 RepID=UPI00345566E0
MSGAYPVQPAEYGPTGQYGVDSGYAAGSDEYGIPEGQSTAYGSPSPSSGTGGYGLPSESGGYGTAGGAPAQSGGYGLPRESGGYGSTGGAASQSGGYGSAGGAGTQSGGYGLPGAAGARSGEYGAGRDTGGYGTSASGGYASPGSTSSPGGGYGTRGGYGTMSGGGSAESGGYGALGGRSSTGTGGYGIPPRSGGGSGQTGGYGIPGRASVQSGEHGTGSGEYESGSGEYGSRGGQYGRASQQPPPRRSSGSGGYRSGTGSHRVVREPKPARRFTLVLAGVAAGVGACVLAAFAILSGAGVGEKDAGQVVGSGATNGSPTNKAERAIVPDACELLGKEVADKLAPNADRTQADNYQSSDRQNQCVWGAYTGENKRQLTVELRAIEGAQSRPPTDVAKERFGSERKADESGQALLAGQELTDKESLDGVGDEGYVVYSVDEGQGSGEAIANVRMVNVLITIHYSGGDDGKPLGSSAAMDGATEAARSVAERLNQG